MARARRTDPATSHAAAASVNNTTATQKMIYNLIVELPCNDALLVSRYYTRVAMGLAPKASESGIRSRRAELVELGLIEDSGERLRLPSGRQSVVWCAAGGNKSRTAVLSEQNSREA